MEEDDDDDEISVHEEVIHWVESPNFQALPIAQYFRFH